MTKMHFEAAARRVRDLRANPVDAVHATVVACEFAALFTQFNPRFDRARFFAACGLGAV